MKNKEMSREDSKQVVSDEHINMSMEIYIKDFVKMKGINDEEMIDEITAATIKFVDGVVKNRKKPF